MLVFNLKCSSLFFSTNNFSRLVLSSRLNYDNLLLSSLSSIKELLLFRLKEVSWLSLIMIFLRVLLSSMSNEVSLLLLSVKISRELFWERSNMVSLQLERKSSLMFLKVLILNSLRPVLLRLMYSREVGRRFESISSSLAFNMSFLRLTHLAHI